MLYMVTFIINLPQMLAYIPYMDPMGYIMADTSTGTDVKRTFPWWLGGVVTDVWPRYLPIPLRFEFQILLLNAVFQRLQIKLFMGH